MAVRHYENFPVASLLLPAELRAPIEVIYRFARSADDFADEGADSPDIRLEKLNRYRAELERVRRGIPVEDALFRDVARIVRAHGLPLPLFNDLLDAFSQDVIKKRYASFIEVSDYCRRSANPVGRLLLHLFKRTAEADLRASDAICSALQLINFLQDVAIDCGKGRVYLPLDEMARYGVTVEQINAGHTDDAWRALMAFQVARARAMLLSGEALGRRLPGRVGLEIRMIVCGGKRILARIEEAHADVFRKRPVLRWHDWPLIGLQAL